MAITITTSKTGISVEAGGQQISAPAPTAITIEPGTTTIETPAPTAIQTGPGGSVTIVEGLPDPDEEGDILFAATAAAFEVVRPLVNSSSAAILFNSRAVMVVV